MNKCVACGKGVYINDPQLSLDGSVYHKSCAKCTEGPHVLPIYILYITLNLIPIRLPNYHWEFFEVRWNIDV